MKCNHKKTGVHLISLMNIMEKTLRKGLEPVNAVEEQPHHLFER